VRLIETRPGIVGIPRLTVVPFFPNIAVGPVERPIQTLEFMGVDAAIGTETMLHGPNFTLLMHQVAKFTAIQAAILSAGLDAILLPFLARIDLPAIRLALLVGESSLAMALAIAAPVSLGGSGCESQACQHQDAEAGSDQCGFHGVAPVLLVNVPVDRLRRRTTAL
jgi:hypothetical protein